MNLEELSGGYRESAEKLRIRLRLLRAALREERDPDRRCRMLQDYQRMTQMHTQCRELQELTARYYERGYCRKHRLVRAYYFEGKSLPAIAREMGINRVSAWRLLKRAEGRMRRYLQY